MGPGCPKGAASRAVALALAAALSGAPALVSSAADPEHRCRCPAGSHACSCPRCAAATRATKAPCHGPAAGVPVPVAAATRPPCHGPGTADPAAAAPERRRPPPDGPCLSGGCQAPGPVATLASGADPFVLQEHAAGDGGGRPERFGPPVLLAASVPASPEPPPPRA